MHFPTCVFHPCRFVLAFSVHAFSSTCIFSAPNHYLANKTYFSAVTVKNIYESFTHKMATKAGWHRNYATVTLCVGLILTDEVDAVSDDAARWRVGESDAGHVIDVGGERASLDRLSCQPHVHRVRSYLRRLKLDPASTADLVQSRRHRLAVRVYNKTRMPVIAASPYRVPKSVGGKGDFGHFRSSQQHADGCV